MEQTNAKRDMDVLLEKMDFYESLLPKKRRKELVSLKVYLLAGREHLDIQVVALAENELLCSEISVLAQPDMKGCCFDEKISQPIVITAMQILHKRITNILKDGKKLNAESEEQAYHQLRIQFKKLRYFIEVMKPLIGIEKYKETIKLIRKMQTILGDFHDYQVQRSLLESYSRDPLLQKMKTEKTISILSKKIQKLEEEQEKVFREKFVEFKVYEKSFRKLFEVY